MTTGVLGGTFDPIHVGHLAAADAAQRALGLDTIVLMPSRIPPHRIDGTGASAADRLAMTELAAAGRRSWSASNLELEREGPSYTFDTLAALRGGDTAPADGGSQFFFIIGSDAFAEIAKWWRYPDVLDLAHFVVVSRPGITLDSLRARVPDLADRMTPTDTIGLPGPTRHRFAQTRVFLVAASTPDVSSTDIRRRVRAGESLAGLVPDAVAGYIRTHRLYSGK